MLAVTSAEFSVQWEKRTYPVTVMVATTDSLAHGCQMARAGFLDRMCLALKLLDYGSATLRCKI